MFTAKLEARLVLQALLQIQEDIMKSKICLEMASLSWQELYFKNISANLIALI